MSLGWYPSGVGGLRVLRDFNPADYAFATTLYTDSNLGYSNGGTFLCRQNDFPSPYDHINRYRLKIHGSFTGTVDLTANLDAIEAVLTDGGQPLPMFYGIGATVSTSVYTGSYTCPPFVPASRPLDPINPGPFDVDGDGFYLGGIQWTSGTLGALKMQDGIFGGSEHPSGLVDSTRTDNPEPGATGTANYFDTLARPIVLTWADQNETFPDDNHFPMLREEVRNLTFAFSGDWGEINIDSIIITIHPFLALPYVEPGTNSIIMFV